MRNDRDNNTGTSEFKAVASEAMQLGRRCARSMGAWLAERSNRMRGEHGQQRGHDTHDGEDDKRSLRQQEGWQEDYQQQSRRGMAGEDPRDRRHRQPPHGAPEQRYGDRQHYQYAGGQRGDQHQAQRHGATHADEARSARPGNTPPRDDRPDAQASDQQGSRYRGQYGAPGAGQGQGREWRSEYGGQPETRYGGTGGHRGPEPRDSGGGYANYFRQDDRTSRSGGHRGRGPRGYSRSDARIAEDLNEQLSDDDLIDASHIAVEVRQGVVALSGTVEERWMKYHVEDLAERCSGVKGVDNQIRVQGSDGGDRASAQSTPTTGSGSAVTESSAAVGSADTAFAGASPDATSSTSASSTAAKDPSQ